MANANVQTAVKRAVSDVREGDMQALKEDVNVVVAQAQKVVGKELGKFRKAATGAADSVSKKAQSYPLASAGLLFGAELKVSADIIDGAENSAILFQLAHLSVSQQLAGVAAGRVG